MPRRHYLKANVPICRPRHHFLFKLPAFPRITISALVLARGLTPGCLRVTFSHLQLAKVGYRVLFSS